MKSIGKARRATTAAMDSPYREGFDAGRNGTLASANPYPHPEQWIAHQEWRDGQANGYALWLQCEKEAGRIHGLADFDQKEAL